MDDILKRLDLVESLTRTLSAVTPVQKICKDEIAEVIDDIRSEVIEYKDAYLIRGVKGGIILKKEIKRLEGFNFYEINEPYYALIKARTDEEATQLYIDVVAGEQSEFNEINENMNQVEQSYAVDRYISMYESSPNLYEETIEEYIEYLLNEEPVILAIDGSLL